MDPSDCEMEKDDAKRLICKALAGCTEAQARRLLWDAAETVDLDPEELLGLDVD